MARKHFKATGKHIFTWLLLISIIIYVAPQSVTGKLQLGFTHLFRGPLSMGRHLSLSVQNKDADKSADQKYIQINNHLANVTQQLAEARKMVEQLSGIRNRFSLEGADIVLADITTSVLSETKNELLINRGSEEGITAGSYVLGANNIIGRITEVAERISRVRLVSDPACNTEVQIAGRSTIMKGLGSGKAGIFMLPAKQINNALF